MFRDEQNAWQLAKNSVSIFEVFSNSRYEGRPPTYFLLLRAFSQLDKSPEAIKLISFVCAGFSAFVILRKFQSPLYLRILLLFSFPFSGTYFVFVREYCLIITLLALLGWMISEDRIDSPIGLMAISALMILNLFGLMMGISLTVYLLLVKKSKLASVFTNKKLFFLVPVALLSAAFMIPPSDSTFVGNQFDESPSTLARLFVYKFIEIIFPLNLQGEYGNEKSLYKTLLLFGAGLVLIFAIGFLFWKTSKAIFATYIIYSVLFFGNVTVGYAWHWWHFGMYQSFVILLSVVCLSEFNLRRFWSSPHIVSGFLTLVLLLVNVLGSYIGPAKVMFSSQEFSGAKKAANAIFDECQDAACFVASLDHTIGVPLAGYLNKSVYFMDKGHFGTFFDWRKTISFVDPITELQEISKVENRVLLASPRPLENDTRIELFFQFSDAVWENYWIYRLVK